MKYHKIRPCLLFLTVGRYKESCSTAVSSCFTPLSCKSGLCECEPNYFYNSDDNTCNTCMYLLLKLNEWSIDSIPYKGKQINLSKNSQFLKKLY